jgi:hypothetical protein
MAGAPPAAVSGAPPVPWQEILPPPWPERLPPPWPEILPRHGRSASRRRGRRSSHAVAGDPPRRGWRASPQVSPPHHVWLGSAPATCPIPTLHTPPAPSLVCSPVHGLCRSSGESHEYLWFSGESHGMGRAPIFCCVEVLRATRCRRDVCWASMLLVMVLCHSFSFIGNVNLHY